VLARVSDIVPGKQRTYDEVKNEIRDRLAEERASQEIQTLHEKVESERSAGKSLKETAESLKLPFREVAEIDRAGKTSDGKPAIEDAEAAKVAEAAFAGAAGVEAEATDLGDGGYVWVDVLGVTPEKQKAFEEVKAEVKAGAMEGDRRKEITASASKLVERLAKGETLEALATETGGKAEKTIPVTRSTAPPGLPQNAVQQAFALPKGGATSAPTVDGKARIVLRVADVIPAPAPTPEQTDHLKNEIARQMQQDVLAEYISGLETRYGLSVNDAALKQALGTPGREQPDE
jgi:peptidyl-prolyl cis-trans isomerase D